MRGTIGTSVCRLAAAAALTLVLSACAGLAPAHTPAPGVPASGTPTPAPLPSFDPDATPGEAMALFDRVNAATLAADAAVDGRDFIDALMAAGFDQSTMELTADTTTIGRDADSIQFSVRWRESCLIGQYGSAVGGYHSTLAPVLGTGKCLIGRTRPIDW